MRTFFIIGGEWGAALGLLSRCRFYFLLSKRRFEDIAEQFLSSRGNAMFVGVRRIVDLEQQVLQFDQEQLVMFARKMLPICCCTVLICSSCT